MTEKKLSLSGFRKLDWDAIKNFSGHAPPHLVTVFAAMLPMLVSESSLEDIRKHCNEQAELSKTSENLWKEFCSMLEE